MYYCMERNTLPWDEYRADQYFTCRVEDAVTVGTYTMSDVAEKRKRMQVELTKPMNCQWEKRETVANTKNRGKWMQEEKATGLKWNETLEFTIQPKYQRVTSPKHVTGLPILRRLVFSSSKRYKSKKYTNRCIDMSWTLEWTQAEYKWDQSISKGLPHLKFLETANAALDAKPGKNAAITCTIVYYLQLQITPNIVMGTIEIYESKNKKVEAQNHNW